MQAFWERGYEATSVDDLVQCMGINRFSLYSTFGGKHQLFVAALERYRLNVRRASAEVSWEREEGILREFVSTLMPD